MNKNKILSGFEEKYGRRMTEKEKAVMNKTKSGIKKRVNKNRKLTKPLKKEKSDHPKNCLITPLQYLQIWNNVSGR